ncbi:hypothetical protein D3C80_1259750 [compost metagenome]
MVIINTCFRIIEAAYIVNDAIHVWRNPIAVSAANKLGIREKPGEYDTRHQLVGMKAPRVRDDKFWVHAVCALSVLK